MSPDSRPVLVVDDDDAIREALRESLELEGYAVAEAHDGSEALAYLRAHDRPLVVLLDWNMGPMDAPTFMRELGGDAGLRDVPVVLITADGRARQKFSSAPFVAYVVKPVKLEKLFSIIGSCA